MIDLVVYKIDAMTKMHENSALLKKFAKMLQQGGVLAGGVPNEEATPWKTVDNADYFRHSHPMNSTTCLSQQFFIPLLCAPSENKIRAALQHSVKPSISPLIYA